MVQYGYESGCAMRTAQPSEMGALCFIDFVVNARDYALTSQQFDMGLVIHTISTKLTSSRQHYAYVV